MNYILRTMKFWLILLSIFVAILAISLWLLKGVVVKEETYIDYKTRELLYQLNDKCSDAELKTVLASLEVYGEEKTEYQDNMNRTSLRTEILKVQKRRLAQWEFGTDEDRSITEYIEVICDQNYEMATSELLNNCTISELQKISDHLDAEKSEEVSSELDLVKDIVNVKRLNTLLNITYLVDQFCVERKLKVLELELIASCSGKRIKKLFNKLMYKNYYDVSCDQCIDKTEFIAAVIDVKRRYYDEVRIKPLLREFCVEPEIMYLKEQLMSSCSGAEVKTILNELVDQPTCVHCNEKAEFIQALVEVKRSNFEVKINSYIGKYCSKVDSEL